MRLCIDLDGVICEIKNDNQEYSNVKPIKGSIETLHKLKDQGYYIILHTARHMRTCDANLGKVTAKIGKITIDWLDKHNVPYDEIYFGKPIADIYIDDNAFRFNNWPETNNFVQTLKKKN